jgi:hypothetical protein
MLSEPQVKNIAHILETLPAAIQAKQIKIIELKDEIQALEHVEQQIKLNYLLSIIEEMNGDKQKYSNDTKRQIELNARLKVDQIYQAKQEALVKAKRQIMIEESHLDFFRNTFNANRALVVVLQNE